MVALIDCKKNNIEIVMFLVDVDTRTNQMQELVDGMFGYYRVSSVNRLKALTANALLFS